jgi:hypothetical protein
MQEPRQDRWSRTRSFIQGKKTRFHISISSACKVIHYPRILAMRRLKPCIRFVLSDNSASLKIGRPDDAAFRFAQDRLAG